MDEEIASSLPKGVAISWGLVKEPQRGPKREMSVGQIVEAAIAIADKDGLSALSMSRLASSLGYTSMSLYRYIPSKDDLLLLMQEAVCNIAIPPESEDENWRDGMREYVRIVINVFMDHPWFGDIPVSGIPLTPLYLQIIDWIFRPMRDLPLNDFEKMSVLLLLSGYARSCGMIQRDLMKAMQSGASPETIGGLAYTGALKQLVKPDRYPNLYPIVMSGAFTGENEQDNTVGNDFEFGLERILDGIEHYIGSRSPK